LVEVLGDAAQLEFMVAPGVYPPLSEKQLFKLVGISVEERQGEFAQVSIANHAWQDPDRRAICWCSRPVRP